jgi:hypothetical protein
MATKFGQLTVLLTARTSKFARSLKGAKTTLGRFAQSVGRMSASIAKIGLVASGAAVAGLSVLVSKSLSSIDATAKLSRSIGLTTEQLVGYQHAAALGGASSEDVGKAFKRMSKNITDAGDGLTTAKRAFAKLGVSEAALAKMSPDEAMKTLADAFAGMTDPIVRAAVAQDVFGKAGMKMLPMLADGAAGLIKMQQEVKALGSAFSDKQAAGVELANNAMGRFSEIIKGAGNAIAVYLAPFITDIVDRINAWVISSGGFSKIIESGMQRVLDVVKVAADWFQMLRATFMFVKSGAELMVGGIVKGLGVMIRYIGKAGDKLSAWIPGLTITTMDTTAMEAWADQMIDDANETGDKARQAFVDGATGATGQGIENWAVETLTTGFIKAAVEARKAKGEVADLGDAVDTLNSKGKGGAGGGRSGQISLTRTAIGGRSSRALGFSEQERNKNRRRGRLFAEDKARNDNWGTLAGNDKFGGLDNSRLMSKLTPIVADKREIALLTDIRNALNGGGVPAMAM